MYASLGLNELTKKYDGNFYVLHITGSFQFACLTHWGRVTHICFGNLTIIGSDNGLIVAWSEPSHYLNQCWNIVNWNLRNKFQWNFNRNSNIFIQENALENVVCEMASILSRPRCVNNWWRPTDAYVRQEPRPPLAQIMTCQLNP